MIATHRDNRAKTISDRSQNASNAGEILLVGIVRQEGRKRRPSDKEVVERASERCRSGEIRQSKDDDKWTR